MHHKSGMRLLAVQACAANNCEMVSMLLTVSDTDPSGVEVVVGDLEVADPVDLDRSAAPAEPCEVCMSPS